jgi:heme A synthase
LNYIIEVTTSSRIGVEALLDLMVGPWFLTSCSVNKGMSIEDFKFIYWMEYAHRMWGRTLGLMFALPFSYFLRKGYITLQLGLRLSALFALGAGQGLIGWWMVKSGLEVRKI